MTKKDERQEISLPDAKRLIEALEAQLEAAECELRKAEELRRQVDTGLQAYQENLEAALRMYRSQRAWQAMLLLRKGYTLLVRRRDRVGFLRWLATLAGESAESLAPYDLTFPRIEHFIPPAVKLPLTTDLQRPARSIRRERTEARQPMYDVIILPVFEFDFRFQRPQQLSIQFARKGHRVFWVSHSRLLPLSSSEPYAALPLRQNLWEIHLRGRCPSIYTGTLADDDKGRLLDSLRHMYRDWGIAESVVIVQLPFWRGLGLGLREAFGSKVVFDCMDDWESMPDISEFARHEERKLVQECDLLVLTARSLHEKYGAAARRSVLVPNGADFEFFHAPRPPRGLLSGVPRPVIGYFGAIANWFDYDLMYRVATARPQYSFVLIGALGLEQEVIGEEIARFRTLPNVFLLGHRDYNELPDYLSLFDVCMIPFVINQVTSATDPVKLYEYLSHGKPVVATALPELLARDGLLYIARDCGEFMKKLDDALLEQDEALRQRRISFASENSWRARMSALDAVVRETFALVSILIVTHNSRDFVGPCLDSIRENTTYPNYEVFVADNGSSDGTVELLRQYSQADQRIRLTLHADNKGFAAANNSIARLVRGDYLIFLNADTMVSKGWVERLIRHHRADSSVGVVVPVTNWAGNEAKVNIGYSDFAGMEEFAMKLAQEKMGLSGELSVAPLFCALVPREVWEEVGELDERFEVGMFEDDDFSVRVRRHNFRIALAEDCFVHHFGRASFAKLPQEEYRDLFHRNLRRFEEKWKTRWTPHSYRPGVQPEHSLFDPVQFAKPLLRPARLKSRVTSTT